MKKYFSILLLIATSLLVNSCKKHETIASPGPVVPYDEGKTISTIVAGKVTDQTGAALNGVEITIGSSTTITDVGGNFIMPKASLGEKCGFIKATKTGYFAGSRTIIAQEKVINNIVIQLVKKTISGSFNNASGGKITIATGGNIVFGANAIALKTGGAYTGTVNVSAYFLDPTTANCFKEMPGDLRGINNSNSEQVLTSYGMIAVELQGSNGEALQIATGKTATLSFPIATSIQANAPATIPLWFFDETKGMWVEQGSATKTGNNYVGTVNHFTWWNADYGGVFINYKVKFVGFHFFPVSNALVTLTRKATGGNWSSSSTGITTSDGSISGRIPYNEILEMKVYASPQCFNSIYTATIGPFTQNTDGGLITINNSSANGQTVAITGTVVNCNNNPVTNGYAIISLGNDKFYENIVNGAINKSIIFCGNVSTVAVSIDCFDVTTLKKIANPITLNITGAGVYNIGQLNACSVQFAAHYKETYVTTAGLPFSLVKVIISDSAKVNYPTSSSIDAIVPLNKKLSKQVYVLSSCNNYVLVDSSSIGPFISDFNAGVMNINYTEQDTITISGTVINCSGSPVLNGFATIGGRISPIANGQFSQKYKSCPGTQTTIIIEVVDNDAHQKNSFITNVGNADLRFDNIPACGTSTSEFLTYKLDTTTYNNYDTLRVQQIGTNKTSFKGASITPYNLFYGVFNSTTTGTTTLDVTIVNGGVTYASVNPASITITEYGTVGQYVAGTYTGTVKNTISGSMHTVTGTFRIMK